MFTNSSKNKTFKLERSTKTEKEKGVIEKDMNYIKDLFF
jgi:hypothetical protein